MATRRRRSPGRFSTADFQISRPGPPQRGNSASRTATRSLDEGSSFERLAPACGIPNPRPPEATIAPCWRGRAPSSPRAVVGQLPKHMRPRLPPSRPHPAIEFFGPTRKPGPRVSPNEWADVPTLKRDPGTIVQPPFHPEKGGMGKGAGKSPDPSTIFISGNVTNKTMKIETVWHSFPKGCLVNGQFISDNVLDPIFMGGPSKGNPPFAFRICRTCCQGSVPHVAKNPSGKSPGNIVDKLAFYDVTDKQIHCKAPMNRPYACFNFHVDPDRPKETPTS